MDENHRQAYDDGADQTIAEELTPQGDLLPPWKKYPEIQAGSLGWRMGFGETYMIAWNKWASQFSHEERIEYFKKYLPIPMEWLSWVSTGFGDRRIAEEIFSGGGEFEGIHWLDQQGLTNFNEFEAWYGSWYTDWQARKKKKG